MDVWFLIGVYLLGASSGALLTRIARQGLSVRAKSATALELRGRLGRNAPLATTVDASAGRSCFQIGLADDRILAHPDGEGGVRQPLGAVRNR
jgi:hypothetical protein